MAMSGGLCRSPHAGFACWRDCVGAGPSGPSCTEDACAPGKVTRKRWAALPWRKNVTTCAASGQVDDGGACGASSSTSVPCYATLRSPQGVFQRCRARSLLWSFAKAVPALCALEPPQRPGAPPQAWPGAWGGRRAAVHRGAGVYSVDVLSDSVTMCPGRVGPLSSLRERVAEAHRGRPCSTTSCAPMGRSSPTGTGRA